LKVFGKIAVWICLFLLQACASRVAPSGGPRDEKPPELVQAKPENNSLFFKAKKIEIEFDEFIELKNGGSKILITPIPKNNPKYVVKRKSLFIEFQDTLEKDVTYVMSFDNSVSDITEGNLTKNFRYVFSTGSYIDSLILNGTCKDAFTGELAKDVTVMLYKENNDSLPFNALPRYFAKTNETGNFTIYNIKAGAYKLFALDDSNDNYLFDNTNEKIGFIAEMIDISDSLKRISNPIYLFRNPLPKQKLMKKNFTQPGLVNLSFAKPVDSLNIEVLFPENLSPLKINLLRNNDSLDIWFPRVETDSLKMLVSYLDDVIKTDTLFFNTKQTAMKGKMGRSTNASDTLLKVTHPVVLNKLSPFDSLIFKFNRPVQFIDSTLLTIITKEDTINPRIVFSPLDQSAYVPMVFKDEQDYSITILPGCFTDLYNRTHDTISFVFKLMDERDFGAFDFKMLSDSLKYDHLLLQLYQKDKVLLSKKYTIGETVKFDKLKPGNYNLRLVVDENNNGKWDTGDYFSKKQAEVILHYPQTVNIRAGWDTENIWEYDKTKSKGN